MQTSNKTAKSHPVLPVLLRFPFKVLPSFVHNRALVATLNKMFAAELKDGELDFLQGKIISILIEDVDIEYRFSLKDDRLITIEQNQSTDLILQGTVYNYLLLASRQEDTDTLFFSRRLRMQGDTELGLYVKNFLDGMDMESHKVPAYFGTVLQKSLPIYERLFS